VCWSLSVEEVFYFICVLCCWGSMLARPGGMLLVAGLLTVLTLGGCSLPVSPTPLPCGYFLRHWFGLVATFQVFLFVGVVLHYLHRGTWRPGQGVSVILGLLSLFAACFHYGPMGHIPKELAFLGSSLLAVVLFATLLVFQARLPYSRLLDRLADISYPLYLVHATVGYMLMRFTIVHGGSVYAALAIAVSVSMTAATLIHRFVERPSNQFGRRLADRLWPGSRKRTLACSEA
jgi:peptidoglycan/LPS O-acetylase OafA/YrhL